MRTCSFRRRSSLLRRSHRRVWLLCELWLPLAAIALWFASLGDLLTLSWWCAYLHTFFLAKFVKQNEFFISYKYLEVTSPINEMNINYFGIGKKDEVFFGTKKKLFTILKRFINRLDPNFFKDSRKFVRHRTFSELKKFMSRKNKVHYHNKHKITDDWVVFSLL